MEFKEQKKQIIKAMKRGDPSIIASRVGTTAQWVRGTLKLSTLADASDMQIRIWDECVKLITERKQKAKETESKVASLAENLS